MNDLAVIFSRGERIGDAATQRTIDTMVSRLNTSGVTRRILSVPLHDLAPGEVLRDFVEDDDTQSIDSDSYANLTGMSITVTPPTGSTYEVMLVGNAAFTNPLVSDGWLAIYDGSAQVSQMPTTILAAGKHPISVSYTAQVTAATTFTLQARKNLAGDANFTCSRQTMSMLAVPQPDRFSTSSSVRKIPFLTEGREPVRVAWARVIRSTGLTPSTSDYYRIGIGIQHESRFDLLAEYDGRTQRLFPGVAFALNREPFARTVRDGDSVVVQVVRSGNPDSLEGTTLEAAFDLEAR